ncbi:MAG: hypothetical protein JKY02_04320 [Flavobacteriaceae bacterium]|nr:hypothetical protein [Flavobacteriaceae bacterium]
MKYTTFLTKKDSIRLVTKELESFITNITSELDEKGASFSKITLEDPLFIKGILYLKLKIQKSNERKINKVILKNYEEFPLSFIKNYFKINPATTFSKQKLEDISILTKGISFVKEVKPPEALFKKDSTFIYLYLEKLNSNSVDAMINLASKEDGNGVLLNGNLDLKLNNVLNSGEQFELFWNRVDEEKSEFKLSTRLPYLFSTAISTLFAFKIYRQDSTFLNTTFNIDLDYQLDSKSNIAISYTGEKSTYLLDQVSNDIHSFSNYFLGIGYHYTVAEKSSFFFKNKFLFNLRPSYGKRQSDINNTNQSKIWLSSYINIPLTARSYLYLKNESGLLESKNYLTNELFRIGGANSIRGFNEQSIFTNKYSFVNIEYRYATSTSSYVHSVTDFGTYHDPILNKANSILGIGLGYLFNMNGSQVNLSYVTGHKFDADFNFRNSKLIVTWKAFF